MGNKMMWIVSGPTCVGKSYFLWKKKDRLSEITNLPPNHTKKEVNLYSYFHRIPRLRPQAGTEHICVHMEVLGARRQREQKVAYNMHWKKISELKTRKRVIILGVPYSKYKSRFKQRSGSLSHLESYAQILELYKNWIGELNKKEIPYFLVESFGDYKIVREDDFFKMLKL